MPFRFNSDDPDNSDEQERGWHAPFGSFEIIARAKKLIADPDFPTDLIVAEVARLMALRDLDSRDDLN